MKTAAAPASSRFLWFDRGGARFAVAMENLQEVLPLPALRTLPVSEPSLAGLMVVREFILPVFDPALMAGSAAVPRQALANAVILNLGDRPLFALIAEEVGKVIPLSAPRRISTPVRLPAAFAGELPAPGSERMLILNPNEFALAMGLTAPPPAVISQPGECAGKPN